MSSIFLVILKINISGALFVSPLVISETRHSLHRSYKSDKENPTPGHRQVWPSSQISRVQMQTASGCHIISRTVTHTAKHSSELQSKSTAFNMHYCNSWNGQSWFCGRWIYLYNTVLGKKKHMYYKGLWLPLQYCPECNNWKFCQSSKAENETTE